MAEPALLDATPLAAGHATRGIGAIRPRPRLRVPPAAGGGAAEVVGGRGATAAGGIRLACRSASRDGRCLGSRVPWPQILGSRAIRAARAPVVHATSPDLVPSHPRLVVGLFRPHPAFGSPTSSSRVPVGAFEPGPTWPTCGASGRRRWCCAPRRRRPATSPSCSTCRRTGCGWSPLAAAAAPGPTGPPLPGPYVLYGGGVDPHKNAELALQAMRTCDPAVRLAVAGPWSSRRGARLRERSVELGVDDRVDWPGTCPPGGSRRSGPGRLRCWSRRARRGSAAGARGDGRARPGAGLGHSRPARGRRRRRRLPAPRQPPAWSEAIDGLLSSPGRASDLAATGRRHAATFSWRATAPGPRPCTTRRVLRLGDARPDRGAHGTAPPSERYGPLHRRPPRGRRGRSARRSARRLALRAAGPAAARARDRDRERRARVSRGYASLSRSRRSFAERASSTGPSTGFRPSALPAPRHDPGLREEAHAGVVRRGARQVRVALHPARVRRARLIVAPSPATAEDLSAISASNRRVPGGAPPASRPPWRRIVRASGSSSRWARVSRGKYRRADRGPPPLQRERRGARRASSSSVTSGAMEAELAGCRGSTSCAARSARPSCRGYPTGVADGLPLCAGGLRAAAPRGDVPRLPAVVRVRVVAAGGRWRRGDYLESVEPDAFAGRLAEVLGDTGRARRAWRGRTAARGPVHARRDRARHPRRDAQAIVHEMVDSECVRGPRRLRHVAIRCPRSPEYVRYAGDTASLSRSVSLAGALHPHSESTTEWLTPNAWEGSAGCDTSRHGVLGRANMSDMRATLRPCVARLARRCPPTFGIDHLMRVAVDCHMVGQPEAGDAGNGRYASPRSTRCGDRREGRRGHAHWSHPAARAQLDGAFRRGRARQQPRARLLRAARALARVPGAAIFSYVSPCARRARCWWSCTTSAFALHPEWFSPRDAGAARHTGAASRCATPARDHRVADVEGRHRRDARRRPGTHQRRVRTSRRRRSCRGPRRRRAWRTVRPRPLLPVRRRRPSAQEPGGAGGGRRPASAAAWSSRGRPRRPPRLADHRRQPGARWLGRWATTTWPTSTRRPR